MSYLMIFLIPLRWSLPLLKFLLSICRLSAKGIAGDLKSILMWWSTRDLEGLKSCGHASNCALLLLYVRLIEVKAFCTECLLYIEDV